MPRKKDPSYRFHKARNCAVVTIAGHDHYLGEYDYRRDELRNRQCRARVAPASASSLSAPGVLRPGDHCGDGQRHRVHLATFFGRQNRERPESDKIDMRVNPHSFA